MEAFGVTADEMRKGKPVAGETSITVVGNLTGDPELRTTSSGVQVASFTVASTPRTYDKQSGEWRDGETLFLRCTVWRDYAANVAQSLGKGARVMALGNLRQTSYETKQGEKRTSFELDVEEVGPVLRNATAVVTRAGRGGPVVAASGGFWSPAPGPFGGFDQATF